MTAHTPLRSKFTAWLALLATAILLAKLRGVRPGSRSMDSNGRPGY
jgi:hypothetical protein